MTAVRLANLSLALGALVMAALAVLTPSAESICALILCLLALGAVQYAAHHYPDYLERQRRLLFMGSGLAGVGIVCGLFALFGYFFLPSWR